MRAVSGQFRDAMRTARELEGWSQDRLAHAAGVSAVFISQIETGLRRPSLSVVRRISECLGLEWREWVFWAAIDAAPELQEAAVWWWTRYLQGGPSEVERLNKVIGLQRAALEVWKSGKATRPA